MRCRRSPRFTEPQTELGAELNAAQKAPERERSEDPTPKRASPGAGPGGAYAVAPVGDASLTHATHRYPQWRGQPLSPATTQLELAGEAGPGLGAFGPLGSPVQCLRLPCRASLLGEEGRLGHEPRPSCRKGSWWGPNAGRPGARARGLLGAAGRAADTTAMCRRTPGTEANSSHDQEGWGAKTDPSSHVLGARAAKRIRVCRGDPLS